MPRLKPPILLISLEQQEKETLTAIFADQLNALDAWAHVKEVTTKKDALAALKAKPQAVVCTDAAIAYKKNRTLAWQIASFANDGGLVLLAGLFAQRVGAEEFDDLVKVVWQLPWRLGDTHKDYSTFNANCANEVVMIDETKNLPKETPLVEAVYVKHVAEIDTVYAPTTYAQGQATVAITDIGDGFFGYIGDIRGDESLIPVWLALCGLFASAL